MNCPHCHHDVPGVPTQCPHCARPALAYPNVYDVEQQVEIDEVARRHSDAQARAAASGCASVAADFEARTATAQAVIGRPIEEALRLAKADSAGYATFYQLLHAGVRFPTGEHWDRLRGLADAELFGTARDHIRFAALSIDGAWLRHYGPVAFELKEPMIAHRATVFEENSAMYFERERRSGHEPAVIAGYRARWADRGKLALAKHTAELKPATTPADFSSLLLRRGVTSADDVFVEVHVYGSLTRRSISRVLVDGAQVVGALVAELDASLAQVNVPVTVC